jgi:hypothetical protein
LGVYTVGTCWYLTRGIFGNLEVKIKRSTFYKYIKDLCDEVGVTRASIGIITGARADLYFDGKWYSVSFDSIEELASKGTDIVFIEKQGVPEMLKEGADKYGVAMVNTRGKLTEYGKDLMSAADSSGAHVAIMADYDNSGIKIASESPTEIPWMGANDKMLEYFNLNRESVSIESETDKNRSYVSDLVQRGRHPTGKYVRSGEFDNRFKDADIDFLYNQRVELDAILAAVGEERFFQYIIDTLKELNPKRDYNRAIEVSSKELGDDYENLITTINNKIAEITKPEVDKIIAELKDIVGFIDVKEKRKGIKQKLVKKLSDNADYKDFADKLTQLVKSHRFFNGIDHGNTGQKSAEF